MNYFIFSTTFLLLQASVQSSNILFFFGVSSYSHRVAVWPLVRSLAENGHNVTFLSPFPAKSPHPNVTDYIPLSLKKWSESWQDAPSFCTLRTIGESELEWYRLFDYGVRVSFPTPSPSTSYDSQVAMCEILLQDEDFKGWSDSNHFHLIVIDSLVNECALGIAHTHRSKVIVYNTATPYPWNGEPFGFPDESSWIPDLINHYPPGDLTFFQRAVGLFHPLYFLYLRETSYFPRLESLLRAHLDPSIPSLSHLERGVSLLFLNLHFAEDYARPLPPSVIPLPALHVELERTVPLPLPPELSQFLEDGAPFFYVSFGSYVELSMFPPEIQGSFTKTFEHFWKKDGIKFVWKTAGGGGEQDDYVYRSKWLDQQAVLAHPKILGFISHAGLLGIQEAISASVPLIVFPIFAEQDYNAEKLEWRGIGIKLEISRVTHEILIGAIQSFLDNREEYSKRMRSVSKTFQERPISSLKLGLWWVEYVLRNEDHSSLKPSSVGQSWWKRRQLDIWFLIFGGLGVLLGVVGSLLCFRKMRGKEGKIKIKVSSYSHRLGVWPLVEALSQNHSITIVSPFPQRSRSSGPHPNITDYIPASLEALLSSWDAESRFVEDRRSGMVESAWAQFFDYGLATCTTLLNDPIFLRFVKETPFELIFIDSAMNECAFGWAWLHSSKTILFNSAELLPWYVDGLGLPDESSWVPSLAYHTGGGGMASFWGRAISLLHPLYLHYLRVQTYFPQLEDLIREKFGERFPPLAEVEGGSALIFLNTHFVEDYPRAFPPNVVPTGGLHCWTNTQMGEAHGQLLEGDLKGFLEGVGEEGFIYMSFGSVIELSGFPQRTMDILLNTIGNMSNVKVVLKFELERPKNFPSTVFTGKWMPQQAILSHPKIRGFISHGGLLGIQEALCHSVPLLLFPLSGDQDYNANKVEGKGIGVKLEITEVSQPSFGSAIQKILTEKSYGENMKRLSKQFMDRPLTPLDSALWWTEWVLRNDESSFSQLRPHSVSQPWWKKRQLDVWMGLLLLTTLGLGIVFAIFRLGFRICCGCTSGKIKRE